MVSLFNREGCFKIPLKAYRSHGSEFLIYKTEFGIETWKDIYAERLCMLNCRPHKGILLDLQIMLEEAGYKNHILVEVLT